MQFKSLFCIQGCDNGQRFAAISGLIYLGLLLTAVITGAGVVLYFAGVLFLPLLVLSGLRRVRDAARPNQLALLPLLPFICVLLTLIVSGSTMLLLTFMMLAAMVTAIFLVLPSRINRSYVMGYSGPVAMTPTHRVAVSKGRVRVEPTLSTSDEAVQAHSEDEPGYDFAPSDTNPAGAASNAVLLTQIQGWLNDNRRTALGVSCGVIAIMFVMSLWSLWPNSTQAGSEPVTAEAPQQPAVQRHSTQMPDGFSLALEQKVLIVRWLGETNEAGEIWSLATARGDKSCAKLTFNNGTGYRPMVVELMPDTGIEARFSPLDTRDIIADMAKRGSVSLCGYHFSLKGSQAALGKVPAFSAYL